MVEEQTAQQSININNVATLGTSTSPPSKKEKYLPSSSSSRKGTARRSSSKNGHHQHPNQELTYHHHHHNCRHYYSGQSRMENAEISAGTSPNPTNQSQHVNMFTNYNNASLFAGLAGVGSGDDTPTGDQNCNPMPTFLMHTGNTSTSPSTASSEDTGIGMGKRIKRRSSNGTTFNPPPLSTSSSNNALNGRRKIEIRYIDDKSRRHITFSKRKAGIMKKAYELSTLTGTQVLLLVASQTGHVYTFATPKLQPLITKPEGKNLIQACLNAPDNVLIMQNNHPGDMYINEEVEHCMYEPQQQQFQLQHNYHQPPYCNNVNCFNFHHHHHHNVLLDDGSPSPSSTQQGMLGASHPSTHHHPNTNYANYYASMVDEQHQQQYNVQAGSSHDLLDGPNMTCTAAGSLSGLQQQGNNAYNSSNSTTTTTNPMATHHMHHSHSRINSLGTNVNL